MAGRGRCVEREGVNLFLRDVILDFDWRRLGPGSLDYQLVTWSRDQALRLWSVDTDIQYRYSTVQYSAVQYSYTVQVRPGRG